MWRNLCVQIQMTDRLLRKVRNSAGQKTVRDIAETVTKPGLDCRGIFAILVLMKHTHQIPGFLNQTFPTIPVYQECGLSDCDLPLVMMYDESKRKVVLRREDYTEAHLDCFDEFTPQEIMAFEKLQWSVLDEEHFQYLKSAGPDRRRERWHYNYGANDQIPLVRPRPSNSVLMKAMIGKDSSRAGTNSEVSLWALSDPSRARPMPDGTSESKESGLSRSLPSSP